MAGVQAETDTRVADAIPQPGDGVEMAGHRVVATRGVLQVDGHVGVQRGQSLRPPLEPRLDIVVIGVAAVHDDCRRIDLGCRITGVLQNLA